MYRLRATFCIAVAASSPPILDFDADILAVGGRAAIGESGSSARVCITAAFSPSLPASTIAADIFSLALSTFGGALTVFGSFGFVAAATAGGGAGALLLMVGVAATRITKWRVELSVILYSLKG